MYFLIYFKSVLFQITLFAMQLQPILTLYLTGNLDFEKFEQSPWITFLNACQILHLIFAWLNQQDMVVYCEVEIDIHLNFFSLPVKVDVYIFSRDYLSYHKGCSSTIYQIITQQIQKRVKGIKVYYVFWTSIGRPDTTKKTHTSNITGKDKAKKSERAKGELASIPRSSPEFMLQNLFLNAWSVERIQHMT